MSLCRLFTLVLTLHLLYVCHTSMVKLTNGGYEDIVIAINPGVRDNPKIIEKIQKMINEATQYLFSATKHRLFIKNVKILIPITWKSNNNYIKPRTETYNKADVIIASPHLNYGNDPYTLQYGGCGEPGKYIHFTPEFFLDDGLIPVYGPQGRVFVHEWAHLRWGVFDEYNYDIPFYFDGNGKIEATRCSSDIIGSFTGQCDHDQQTGLYTDGCVFVPDRNQAAQSSIMYLQGFPSVTEFCDSNHNTEAPTLQNRICNFRSTWDVIKNSSDIKSTTPHPDLKIPAPTFSLLQYSDRVVTLVLDVSGSMASDGRIGRLYQAAELFLLQIVEESSHVGIVQFHSSAAVLSPLVQIISQVQRNKLKSLLPKNANGGTNICTGIRSGIEVNKKYDGSTYGTELVVLTDGEDNVDTSLCFTDIRNSGAIIHVIALGPNAAKALEQMVDMTGGLRFLATDKVDANGLIDAFASLTAGNGAIAEHAIQLESTGSVLKPRDCLEGTVFIDHTVGNGTFFLVTWVNQVPEITLNGPKGNIYDNKQFINDATSKASRLEIPGTAERGAWQYKLCNTHTANQAIGISVTSKQQHMNLYLQLQCAHMNVDTKNSLFRCQCTSHIEPITGNTITLDLLDNGAGADIIKNDGVYSRYFTSFQVNGRYSLKVRVESRNGNGRLALRESRALYIPGFSENGKVTLNPTRPVINETSGYDLRMGMNPTELRKDFNGSTSINISSLSPQVSGSSESFTFVPKDIVIANGTILYFALIAFDEVAQKSDLSNIAQAALIIPPTPAPTTKPTTRTPSIVPATQTHPIVPTIPTDKLNITFLTLIVCSAAVLMCLIISITVCIVQSCKKKRKNPQMRL
ncbi:hypothetical protein GDO86_007686 [Hymenochirus boettgeri]|uniref:VWFA domain-containing protein n=1 Tax=Hymenochirus boettgeri TaxID=247094 RepID=A0A8T2IYV1_9PIPI|nr:hypothetical protein GDO86_007686 [Hymenochirus boettgeri]